MHPSFRQSVAYMACQQEQCVSDITELTPANSFPNFKQYGIKQHITDLAVRLAISGGRSSLIFKRHDCLFSRFVMDFGLLLMQLIWAEAMVPVVILVSKFLFLIIF